MSKILFSMTFVTGVFILRLSNTENNIKKNDFARCLLSMLRVDQSEKTNSALNSHNACNNLDNSSRRRIVGQK